MSALEDFRHTQDRDLGSEGIPMYLALVDETVAEDGSGGDAVPAPAGDPADGRAVAAHLDALRAELAPSLRDGDLGVTTSVLSVAAYNGFGRTA